ncbi:MAG: hypothetical protein A3K12_06000 [Candidatus Rokubacteria bacterium RIFCSPLOWO2_12_FULL_71_19]|nr:MAG: hypothetical protein A3K12_06000 [Candidatus Rokubacteria bacterium RIFCSPLOWO2_12_FULL_71_19]
MRACGALVFLSLGLVACQTTMPMEEAKRVTVVFGGAKFVPPPRTIEDITAVLDQYEPKRRQASKDRALVEQGPPTTRDRHELAVFFQLRGGAARRLGMVSQHLSDLRTAAAYAEGDTAGRYKNRGDEIMILAYLARAEGSSGNLLNAVQVSERILARIPANRPGSIIGAYSKLALAQLALGDIPAARQTLADAQRVRMAATNPLFQHKWTADVESIQAEVSFAEGKLADAEKAIRRALTSWDLDQPFNKAREQNVNVIAASAASQLQVRDSYARTHALILMRQGRLAEAEAAARDALRKTLAREGRYVVNTALAVSSLSQVIFEQGRYREAELLAVAAVDIYERAGVVPESVTLADARKAVGTALVAQEKWREAIAEFEKRQAGIARGPLLVRKYGAADIDWGLALVKVGEAPRALPMMEASLQRTLRRLGGDAAETALDRGYLALALAGVGKVEQALEEFSKAIPVLLDSSRAEWAGGRSTTARMLRLRHILDAYIGLLADSHLQRRSIRGLDAISESFRLAEVARGSRVQQAVTASAVRARVSDPALAELARREQDMQLRLGMVSDSLSEILAAPSDQQVQRVIADLRREIAELRAERMKIKSAIQERFPDYAHLVDPRPASIAQATAALGAEEALISTYVGRERTYVWAVPKQGAVAFAVIPLGEAMLATMVGELRKALDVGTVTVPGLPVFDVAVAHRLYAALLEPVRSGWHRATSLVIVPHRMLGQLPFSILVTAPTRLGSDGDDLFSAYRAVPWLARTVATSQVPSVSSFATLRSTPPGPSSRRAFIGFGDPFFSTAQALAATRDSSVGRSAAHIAVRSLAIPRIPGLVPGLPGPEATRATVPSTPDVANSSTLAQLPRLPDTGDEIREIARVLGADARLDVFLGPHANENNVKTVNLADRRVIAFATHGLTPGDLDGLEQPALALSAPEVAGTDGDGLLTMDEILGLKLDADWVVLSACNTASTEGAGSEAFSGLGRAFFYAGARAMLLSNWPVETVSAKRLTSDLFKRQAENRTLTRAEALRATMLGLMDGPGVQDDVRRIRFSYAHPIFWAPFSLIGDGGR